MSCGTRWTGFVPPLERSQWVMISRREVLAATAAGAVMSAATARAASFGNPDEPPQGAINAKNPGSVTDPGPQNPAVVGQFPSAVSPPATDVGGMPMTWASFNNAPRDRKSTRLNSSHGYISYAVFCLKKKKWASTADSPDSPRGDASRSRS